MYEAELARLGERPLAQLEGPEGLLAVTETALLFLSDQGVQRLELARIRRVTRGEGGTVLVQGDAEALSIPLKAFPLEELKAFLEGLKPHVARAKKATAAPRPEPPQPPPPAAKAPPREGGAPANTPPAGPAPARPPPAQGTRNPLALPLRLLALLTLAYAVGFAATHPDADPWVLGGVVLGGLTLALTAWSSATSSR